MINVLLTTTYSASSFLSIIGEGLLLGTGKGLLKGFLAAKYSVAVSGVIFDCGASSIGGGVSGRFSFSSSDNISGDGVSRNTLLNCSS